MRFSLTHALLLPVLLSALAACDPAAFSTAGRPAGGSLPEGVRALAGPNQNLDTARVLPEDGCYWYEYTGPVETTLLPLRTADGRPICTSAAVAGAEAAQTTAG